MPTLNKYEGKVDFDQLIVCYHKQKSLRNVLAPRIGRFGTDFSVNAALKAFKYQDNDWRFLSPVVEVLFLQKEIQG